MAESQPGTVVSFDPSVTLAGFSAEDRDRTMFNENQLVLAKIQQPRPILATAVEISGSTGSVINTWADYKNLQDDFSYIDGSFQALDTPGVPTGDVHRITIGFDQQVSTGTIIFWSTGFIDTVGVIVEYSFDNITWFSSGTVTWSQVFDDSIEVFPGDSPPTGEFKYTGTLSSPQTGRYWRIKTDTSTTYSTKSGTNPNLTVTVGDTSTFLSTGTAWARGTEASFSFTYTGKTSSTLTGVNVPSTGDTTFTGVTTIAQVSPDLHNISSGQKITEIQIIPTLSPTLEHWNSDGTKAVTNAIQGEDYYDITYDAADDSYYAIRFNSSLTGTPINPDDSFDTGTTASFDTSRWVESTTNTYFQRNTSSGTLDLKTANQVGQLVSTYGLDGSYTSSIDLTALVDLGSASSYLSLEAKEFDTGNQTILSAIKGPYGQATQPKPGRGYTYERSSGIGTWGQTNKRQGSDAAAGDQEGFSVALEGDIKVFGAPHDDDNGTSSGSVYVIDTVLGESKLAASDAAAGDQFGFSVAVSGTYLVIGAPEDNSAAGAAYVFERNSGTGVWTQVIKLTSGVAAAGERFGDSVSISGSYIIVSSPDGTTDDVEIFERIGGVWATKTSFASSSRINDVAMSGTVAAVVTEDAAVKFYERDSGSGVWSLNTQLNTGTPARVVAGVNGTLGNFVVGTPLDNDQASIAGAVYVYKRDNGGTEEWIQTQKVYASDAKSTLNFGTSVSVGTKGFVVGSNPSGSAEASDEHAYIFEVNNTTSLFQEATKVSPSDVDSAAKAFGTSVAMSSTKVLIGARFDDSLGNNTGSVYEYLQTPASEFSNSTDATLTASDTAITDEFSWAVDISTDTLVIGSKLDDDLGADAGAAYVYQRAAGAWTLVKKLTGSTTSAGDQFGYSVAIDGNTIVIGAPYNDGSGANAGAAYVFDRAGGAWTEQTIISGTTTGAGDEFGYSVDVHVDNVVVGAPGDSTIGSGAGSIYIFDRSGGTWPQAAVKTTISGGATYRLGQDVGIDTDTVVAGAPFDDTSGADIGAAYIFDRAAGAWNQIKRLDPLDGAAGDEFGAAVDISGSYVAVGAPKKGSSAGSLYTFIDGSGTWNLDQKILPNDPTAGDEFGRSVAIDATTLVAGAKQADGSSGFTSGAAYVYKLDSSTWAQENKLEPPNGAEQDNFATSVGVSDNTIITGAPLSASVTVGNWVGASLFYSDTVAGAAQLQDLKINVDNYPFGTAASTYSITYNASNQNYDVFVDGVANTTASPGIPTTTTDGATTFTVSNLSVPSDGQGFVVTIRAGQQQILDSATTSGGSLQIERASTNGYARYREATDSVYSTVLLGNTPNTRHKIQLYGGGGSSVDYGADTFTASGTVYYPIPVLSVVTLDKSGNLQQVTGVSDSNAYAIKRLDVTSDVNAKYIDLLSPRVGIATNGLASGSGGELYIKVNDKLFRYTKSSLPLDLETGASAAVTSTGQIPVTGITAFAYNGYSQAGLSYIEFDTVLNGTYLKSIESSTLAASDKKALLDVTSASFPFAWNVSDLSTLYFVSGTSLKLYDLNETKAAFVVVTADKQVLSAGTAQTATISAQIINIYGEPKSNKSMTFTVSAGDGAISPATACSNVNGIGTTTYTVGAAVGTATITVSASDTAC